MFQATDKRFATIAVASQLPDALIDALWLIIDHDLQGVFPLKNLLQFSIAANDQNNVQISFDSETTGDQIAIDTQAAYHTSYPETVLAYDDGHSQTILLPSDVDQD
ncbi:DUF960 domain-containing protein [Lapidilactobacillus achengensis]|uniref:DUF960 domain-containing protein n=1 Tax=Lapidilactobacillus achengensis TaxID=2486000 RepID=A0ABW1UQ24_9LACO|nr:DUF960 domain-containing protein [Lapidilactobacillus achengensis]